MGHSSTEGPYKNTNNKKQDQANTLECNHFTDSMEEEVLMVCQDCQPKLNYPIEMAFSATNTGPLYPLDPTNDLRNWLIDSGFASHFTPHPEDLQDMEPCQIDITVADGSTVLATHTGKATIGFTFVQGKETKL
eukprot:6865200-Ditylum_brightwellii.AAC.1